MGELAAIDAGTIGATGIAKDVTVGGWMDVGSASQLANSLSAPSSIQFLDQVVLMVRDPGGKLLGTTSGLGVQQPFGSMHLSDFATSYGLSIGFAFGGFTIMNANGAVSGYFSGYSRDVHVSSFELDATISSVTPFEGMTVAGIPDPIGGQIEGFYSPATGRVVNVRQTQQVLGYGLYSAAQGVPVCNSQSFYNFWNNAPSYFSWDFIAGTSALLSVRTGKTVTPYNGTKTINFSGALVNNPNMPLMAVCASGYSFMLDPLGHDPINVIDPTTGRTAVPAGFVQMLMYDGCRQFSANATWGYKGAQPTDRMTAATYAGNTNPGGVGPAGSTEGPQG